MLLALALTGCGGGSSGGVSASANDNGTPANNNAQPGNPTTPTTLAALSLTSQDTLLATTAFIGNGEGIWGNSDSGGDGGSDSGSGDGAGGAGDGEFIRFNVRFPNATSKTGTLTWTVLASQYNILGQTGTMTIERDLASTGGVGGYKVIAGGGPNQANFLLSTSGQISGTLPLKINGKVKDTLFNGMRFKDSTLPATTDASQAFADIQGMYGFAGLAANAGTGSNADTNGGFFQVKADGSVRICPDVQTPAAVSSTCTDGKDLKLSFNDPNQRDVILIKSVDPTQTFNAYAVAHKFTSPAAPGVTGVSMTIDYAGKNSEGINRTGTMFASRLPSSGAIAPASAVGAWNYTGTNITNPGASNASSSKGNLRIAIANIGGTVKVGAGTNANACEGTGTLTATPNVPGSLSLRDIDPQGVSQYLIMLDQDSAVVFMPRTQYNDTSIGLARRYSKDPTVAPCQPV